MAIRPLLTALVITRNEATNIARCLRSLQWVDEILVVDSGSTDKTTEIAASLGAKVLHHEWEGYGQQKNWGFAQARHNWILSIDADEEVSSELREEIASFLASVGDFKGARFPRKTWYLGRWILHGGWYPNALVRLVDKRAGRWTEPAVHEELQVNGPIASLKSDLYHYTFQDVGEQVETNIRFSRLGAKVARARGESAILVKLLLKPIGKFLETYLWKRGFLDGLPGFVISVNAAHSIFMKYVELRFEKDSHHR